MDLTRIFHESPEGSGKRTENIQLVPPAALPGAKLLKSLINRFLKLFLNEFYLKGGCDLTRGTRAKTHLQPAFKVAHLTATRRVDFIHQNYRP